MSKEANKAGNVDVGICMCLSVSGYLPGCEAELAGLNYGDSVIESECSHVMTIIIEQKILI